MWEQQQHSYISAGSAAGCLVLLECVMLRRSKIHKYSLIQHMELIVCNFLSHLAMPMEWSLFTVAYQLLSELPLLLSCSCQECSLKQCVPVVPSSKHSR